MSLGIYVHIPFCLQQCPYCDFTTAENNYSLHHDYVENLLKEIDAKKAFTTNKNVQTIYFGGGTPSLLSPGNLQKILGSLPKSGFDLSNVKECTLEINPGTIDQNDIDRLTKLGFNRFSVGAQSFNDKLLSSIGRKHSGDDTRKTLDLLKQNDLNFSFDLMFALPGQTLEMLEADLKEISDFDPPHISTYYLTLPPKHKLNLGRPNEDLELEMFDRVEDHLACIGYDHYELSNHAKPDKKSLHNLSAWEGNEYLGLGVSAHSHLNQNGHYFRFWNSNSLEVWKKKLPKSKYISEMRESDYEKLSPLDRFNDAVHTRLRLKSGLSMALLETIYSAAKPELLKKLSHLEGEGLVCSQSNNYHLTRRGRRLLNYVLERLYIS